ncbi:ubiquitin carboxyl-terminal hydrolase, partial [Striga asiatica]
MIENRECQCIAHRAFSGLLRSDLTCTSCGCTSSTYDPFIDISLDLNTNGPFSRNSTSSKPNEALTTPSLANCLDQFTRPEKLEPDQKLYCENCREKQNALKQLSLEKLPLVLCLHIKRFEHSATRRMCRKIDRHLKFPFSLDMGPYLSSSIIKKRFGNRVFSFEGEENDSSSAEFEVFAVVTHSGMLESGHYVTYLRLSDQWYKCDDAWVTEVDDDV